MNKNNAGVIDRYKGPMEKTEFTAMRIAKIRQLLPVQGTLLEVGVLDGTTLAYYKERFKGRACGIDISMELMKGAEKVADEIKECDLNQDVIPWPDGFFDVVVCSEVIEHIMDTDRLLQEIHRVLSPTGTLILTTPNLASFVNRMFILFGLQPLATEVSSRVGNYGNPFRKPSRPAGHVRDFTFRAMKDIVRGNDFSIVSATSVPISVNKAVQLIERITGVLSTGLGSVPILVCRKNSGADRS